MTGSLVYSSRLSLDLFSFIHSWPWERGRYAFHSLVYIPSCFSGFSLGGLRRRQWRSRDRFDRRVWRRQFISARGRFLETFSPSLLRRNPARTFQATWSTMQSLGVFLQQCGYEQEVEAYSTVDGHRIGAVTVPGPAGLSLSPDGTQLAVGTTTPYLYFVNPAALHVTAQVAVPSTLLTGLLPILPFLMATGPMLIEAGNSTSLPAGDGALLSYDSTSGAFALANPTGTSGIYGGIPARSLDGNYLAVPTLGQTGAQMAVYSAQSQTYIGSTPTQGSIGDVGGEPGRIAVCHVGLLSLRQ